MHERPTPGAVYAAITPAHSAEGAKLSGTRIETEIALAYSEGLDVPTWESKEFKVYWTNLSESNPIFSRDSVTLDCAPFKFRYATTLVDDGENLVFRVTGKVRASMLHDWEDVDLTFTFQAHNKLQLLGTNVLASGTTSSFMQAVSDGVTNAAKDALQSSHSSDPPGGSARSETQASILSKTQPSTTACFFTHGSNLAISDSTHGEGAAAEHSVDFENEIGPEVEAKQAAGSPQFNILALYSCSTLSSPVRATFTYKIDAPNQAYLSFDNTVSAALWSPSHWEGLMPGDYPSVPPDRSLGDHASELWTRLAAGDIVEAALAKANALFPPVHGEWDPGSDPDIERWPMIYQGDAYARIHYVWLTSSQRNQILLQGQSLNIWWIAL